MAQVYAYYGKPVEPKSTFMYFTSWKYVRQGSFSLQIQQGPTDTDAAQNMGA